MAGWLALLAAVFLVLARILRLGFLADFLSATVLIGFLTGVGVQVAFGQVPGMLGVAKTGHGAVAQAFNAVREVATANPATVVVSAAVIVVIVGGRAISKKFPGALIAVIGSIVASAYFNLEAKGVETLGAIPRGLPHLAIPTLPPAGAWTTLVATAGSLFLVILAQSAATSRAYATKYDDAFNENTDLVGLGLANVAAGVTGTFVVNGSPTKTQMVDGAGGKSQLSQLTTAAIVLLVLLFLTRPLSFMPNAVLAAVVFLIGVELVDIKGMTAVYRARQAEFWVAIITAVTVVAVGVEQGIILAIVLSLILHVRHSYRPTDLLVTYTDGETKTHPFMSGVQAEPGLLVYRFGASLYYANTEVFLTEVIEVVDGAQPKAEWFVLEFSAIGDIDFTAAAALSKLVPLLTKRGVTFGVTDATDDVLQQMGKTGLVALIGEQNVHGGMRDTIEAYKNRAQVAARATGSDSVRGPDSKS
jgi:MFS superfamily sulfate permease-like transporter